MNDTQTHDINRHANRHSPGVGKEAGGRHKGGFIFSIGQRRTATVSMYRAYDVSLTCRLSARSVRSTAAGGSPSAGCRRGTWEDMEGGEGRQQLSAKQALHISASNKPFSNFHCRSHNSCPLMTHKPMISIDIHANRQSLAVFKRQGEATKTVIVIV